MVNFFYSMNYDDEIPEETGDETRPPISLLQLHARMFALGDRYDVPGLRDMAVKKYLLYCIQDVQFMPKLWQHYDSKMTPEWSNKVQKAYEGTSEY